MVTLAATPPETNSQNARQKLVRKYIVAVSSTTTGMLRYSKPNHENTVDAAISVPPSFSVSIGIQNNSSVSLNVTYVMVAGAGFQYTLEGISLSTPANA